MGKAPFAEAGGVNEAATGGVDTGLARMLCGYAGGRAIQGMAELRRGVSIVDLAEAIGECGVADQLVHFS